MFGNKSISSIIILSILLLPCILHAQKTKNQLQKEKQENLQKIEEAEKILAQTQGKKNNTLGQLSALNQRIKTQEALVGSIRKEIGLLNEEIGENNNIIAALEEDLDQLKEEYAAMVYATHKANRGFNRLTFLFSAASFNQFLMRLKYMEQYGETRKKQGEQIGKVQDALSGQITIIQSRMSEKSILLAEQLKEGKSLAKLRSSKTRLVASLQKEESKLAKDLKERRKAVAKLEKYINDIIREEMAKARLAEKSAEASLKLSTNFAENKSKLPWPVKGFVAQKFGRQNHPILKRIVLENTGIQIQTSQGERVKSIFEGEVSMIAFVKYLGNTLLISHGDYFTVYAGLKEVFVKKGQKISTGQELGTVLTNKEGVSELKFEIRKNDKPLDPQLWLSRN
ncbi:MAG: peptidoglycan DD-metalloendopeptidase family protein [Cytophagales bacterium]|nr:peptidoglycan DD-metalloendopeptidase family protein [Cytophagales bacterium]